MCNMKKEPSGKVIKGSWNPLVFLEESPGVFWGDS